MVIEVIKAGCKAYWSLLAGRAAVGTAEAGGSSTGMSILSDYFGTDTRATAIGIWYLSAGIGFAIAFFAGGLIVAAYGWRMTFLLAGVPGLLLAPFLLLTLREPKRGQMDKAEPVLKASLWPRLKELLARPGIAYGVAAITCIATAIYGMSTWLATFLVVRHGQPLAQAGTTVAIAYGLLGSVGGLAAGLGVDRINARRGGFDPARTALIASAIPILTAISGLAAMATSNSHIAIGCIMAAGLFSSSYNGPVNAMIVTQAGAEPARACHFHRPDQRQFDRRRPWHMVDWQDQRYGWRQRRPGLGHRHGHDFLPVRRDFPDARRPPDQGKSDPRTHCF